METQATKREGPQRVRNRKSRSKGLRANTGCITCRRRHLKCDETRPRCVQCEKSSRICEYRSANDKAIPREHAQSRRSLDEPWTGRGEPQTTSFLTSSDEDGRSGEMSSNQNLAVESPQWHRGMETPMATNTSLEEETRASNTQQSPHRSIAIMDNGFREGEVLPVDLAHSSPEALFRTTSNTAFPLQSTHNGDGYHSHTSPNDMSIISVASMPFEMSDDVAISKWFDLLAGDASINLDDFSETAPQPDGPGEAQAANDAAIWSWSSRVGTPRAIDLTLTENALWTSETNLELQYHELKIFRNFLNTVGCWIDLFDPYQHFSILVPRLALRNEGLLNAILALSTRHLSLNPHLAGDTTYTRNEALEYYHTSLKYVARAMQYDSYNTSDELLATALVISAYEMLDGSRRDWERHLQGVFWIQRSQIIHGDTPGLRGAIWWSWLCQDCWAAFKDKRKPFSFWRPQRTSFKRMSSWELAARSMFLFKGVVAYCADKKDEDPQSTFSVKMDHAEGLSRLLDEWRKCLPIDFEPLPTSPNPEHAVFRTISIHPPPFAVAMQVHNASRILISLHRPLLGGMAIFLEQQNLLNECVNQICGIAKGLSDVSSSYSNAASSVLSSQCLYIAGTCTHDINRREEIVSLIKSCHAKTGWPVRSLDEELREIWRANG